MEPQTVTLVAAGIGVIGTLLGAAGALGGVVGSHFLSRSWQREQWIRDKRNEEFRELLDALAESYRLALTIHAGLVQSGEEQRTLVENQSRTMAVIRSRIFTADVVERCGVEVRWAEAIHNHNNNLEIAPLATAFTKIRLSIMESALLPNP